ncbi:hypothetical protein WH47_05086 [Habropoda laboriosa]|uniref:Uncharacterized protein n=1 Tax=Habropoda laboriosa TaxID=597456 RepID=A0A0L7QS67_9HYME|nr:PREDICTED: uncharacterized protein LOC108575766 [Habropoda laboriosa]KOC61482.1 hypothetical protein WH47_05086 [Habropoda laboriosa]
MNTSEYSKLSTGIQGRNYYNGYGETAVTSTYYPAFDPLSVMASLAFLAFLFQSLVSLFDRSRSVTPTAVTARQFMELKMLTLTTQILHALEKYEKNRNGKLSNAKHKIR